MNKDQEKYIKSAAVMLWFTPFHEGPKIMLCQRLPSCKKFVGRWGAAGGKVDDGECIVRAAQRELQEETGFYVLRDDLKLIDSHYEGEFKCFMFEATVDSYLFNQIKNTEPKKHTDWQLFTLKEALALPDLMPALRKILLTK